MNHTTLFQKISGNKVLFQFISKTPPPPHPDPGLWKSPIWDPKNFLAPFGRYFFTYLDGFVDSSKLLIIVWTNLLLIPAQFFLLARFARTCIQINRWYDCSCRVWIVLTFFGSRRLAWLNQCMIAVQCHYNVYCYGTVSSPDRSPSRYRNTCSGIRRISPELPPKAAGRKISGL